VTKADLIIVGGGPGGYIAALRAARLGFSTALVEGKHLGGVCLNWGCIPLKALLRSADVYRLVGRGSEFGIAAAGVEFRLDAIVKRSRSVVARLRSGVKHLLKNRGVTVVEGFGRLEGGGRVSVARNGKPVAQLIAPHIILATGARPKFLPGIDADADAVWTYMEALSPTAIPKTLVVIGAGAIGIELASFYATFGADVTVVELEDRILPAEDEEISRLAREALERQGISFLLGASLKGVANGGSRAVAVVSGTDRDTALEADKVLLAAGIVGNVENLGLEKTAVRVEKGHIVVDEWLRTGEPGVYAIGDVAGPPWLAHKASHEGVVCVEKIAGATDVRPLDPARIPGCVFCHPQVASLGLTERQARENGREVRIGRFPFAGNGKAIALGEAEGMVKTVFDAATGALLGAHMIGADASELIQGFSIAATLETTESELMETVFPHPTLSEMVHESVLEGFGRGLHI
jgi:dihydrolipoamide dehydrogenase